MPVTRRGSGLGSGRVAVGKRSVAALPVPCEPMLFDVAEQADDGWQIVRVVGDVDLASAPVLRTAIRAAAGRASAERCGLAIDLSSCDFIDSIGIGVVLGGLRRQVVRELPFAVVAGPGRVRELFSRLRLDEVVALVGDRASLGDQRR